MRQFIGATGRRARSCATCCSRSRRHRCGGRRAARRRRAGDDGARRRAHPAALRRGAHRLGRSRRLRPPRCTGTSAASPPSASRTTRSSGARSAPCPAASRSAWSLSRCCAGGRVLLLDEPDNYLDVPGKRWLEEQLARRPRRCCWSATTASCSRPARSASSPSRTARLGARRRVRRLTRRRARTGSSAWRSCAAAGTRSTTSSRNSSACTGEGGLQLRHGLPAAGRGDPAGEVRGEGPPEEPPREQNIRVRLNGGAHRQPRRDR